MEWLGNMFVTSEAMVLPVDETWLKPPLADRFAHSEIIAREQEVLVFFSVATHMFDMEKAAWDRFFDGEENACLYINTHSPYRNEVVLISSPVTDASGQSRCPAPW
jgi:hypothetical protein